MAMINVLVFPAQGATNDLHEALSTCVNIHLVGASSIDRHGDFIYENYVSGLPMISDMGFLTEFNRVLDEYAIDVVFPAHDTVAKWLVDHRDELHAKVIAADRRTTNLCRDKLLFYREFAKEPFIPRIYDTITQYPVFLKPREGQGGKGACLVRCEKDIPNVDLNNYVVSEYLPGEEWTVDC